MTAQAPLIIVYSIHATYQEHLAAREIRRYVYLRTGILLELTEADELPAEHEGYHIVREGEPQTYRIGSHLTAEGRRWLRIAGGTDGGVLYGAYRTMEHLGVRYALHGDILPDNRIPLGLPDIEETGKPLFELRGILPFHDFPEGPDWWNEDDYHSAIAQLAKLRMNFFSLHTYPEKEPDPLSYNAEPGVWIGPPGDVLEDAQVARSYPARHYTTFSEAWGYAPRRTSDFADGAGELFERDDYGADYMIGMTPWPGDDEAENRLFERFGQLLRKVFSSATALGIRTCIGTETPLTLPEKLRARLEQEGMDPADPRTIRLVYEGIFKRIVKAHPLDYYWLWTPEDWTWKGNTEKQAEQVLQDVNAALDALDELGQPFTLATCGWVLGPEQDRTRYDRMLPDTMPFSCINRQLGFDFIDTGFRGIASRPKWAIPWLEDDPAMILPQLWAGRLRRDAADAAAYGCSGFMGIHWRTKIIDPNITALAAACWSQQPWNPKEHGRSTAAEEHRPEGTIGGSAVSLSHPDIEGLEGGRPAELYKNARVGLEGYRLLIPNGTYQVTIHAVEWVAQSVHERVFTISVYSQTEAKALTRSVDLYKEFGCNRAGSIVFDDMMVIDGSLDLTFSASSGEACVCAIEIEGVTADVNQFKGEAFSRKINCGGEAVGEYEGDLAPMNLRKRTLPTEDFYLDWAASRFGPEAAQPIAAIFASIDGKLPRPVVWGTGPGSTVTPDRSPWEVVSRQYAFLKELETLRGQIRGTGNLERFDYWLHQFRYLQSVSQLGCELGVYEEYKEQLVGQPVVTMQRKLAEEQLLPLRIRIIRRIKEMNRHLIAACSTPGELGTIANIQQQVVQHLVVEAGQELEALLGTPLPSNAWPDREYDGPPRMIVPTVRTQVAGDETIQLKVILLAAPADNAHVCWRFIGADEDHIVPLEPIGRSVYRAVIPPGEGDIEYFIHEPVNSLRFPASGGINQTVIRMTAH